ncbi:hypothetical protein F5B20DRAFT_557041 [Whalleya microplaca]|nr:hypothetical protein F5B20DRAFT_557041 [Whalleya microplaca]
MKFSAIGSALLSACALAAALPSGLQERDDVQTKAHLVERVNGPNIRWNRTPAGGLIVVINGAAQLTSSAASTLIHVLNNEVAPETGLGIGLAASVKRRLISHALAAFQSVPGGSAAYQQAQAYYHSFIGAAFNPVWTDANGNSIASFGARITIPNLNGLDASDFISYMRGVLTDLSLQSVQQDTSLAKRDLSIEARSLNNEELQICQNPVDEYLKLYLPSYTPSSPNKEGDACPSS